MHKNGAEFPVELTITRIGAPRAADVHRLPPRHHRPQAGRGGAARVARPARRGRRRRAPAHPAEPPRRRAAAADVGAARPSAGCARSADGERAALLDVAIEELAAGLQELRELASGLHPVASSPSGASRRRSRRSRCARRSRSSSPPCPTVGCRSRSRRPRTTSSPRRSRTSRSTPARSGSSSRRPSTRRALLVEVEDDGAGGADPEGERPARARRSRRGARRDARASTARPGGGTRVVARLPVG